MALSRHEFQAALGRAVRRRRAELRLTQEELANRSGLHPRWISKVEGGWRNPSLRSLHRLAASLDLGASELVAEAERLERDSS
jgi:transcriptional regulator with XRE-family HTH domain